MPDAATAARIHRVFDALDWSSLGELYCDEGGDAFWDHHREPALRQGFAWADALLDRLGGRPGRSLWVGAGVAELPAMLAEAAIDGRELVAVNLRAAECRVLAAGLAAAGVPVGRLRIDAVDALDRLDRGPFDHVSLVSVLTDPETWPLTSAVTYGRIPPVLLDVDGFVAERRRIEAFVAGVAGALAADALVATTVDEAPWFFAWRDRTGAVVEVDDEVLDTAVVGDPMGFLRVRRGGG